VIRGEVLVGSRQQATRAVEQPPQFAALGRMWGG
jgi:hypothetical protein